MKKTLIITTILCITALALGCSTTEPVELNADDVVYGTEGKTVGDTLDTLGKTTGNLPHTHEVVDITDLDLSKYSTVGHGHKASDITGLSPYTKYTDADARTAMGAKGNTNSFNHDRYGETDLKASATIIDIYSKVGGGTATTSPDCPAGYTPKSVTEHTKTWDICMKGVDEMVKVGDFWIDRYEGVLTTSYVSCPTKFDYTGYLIGYRSNLPVTFSDAKKWVYAIRLCSVSSTMEPTSGMNYFQAQQACSNAGKHLCTNAEWQAAAAGTTNGNFTSKPDTTTINRDSYFGAYNMLGNLQEWVAGIVPVGTTSKALLRGGSVKSTTVGLDYLQTETPSTTAFPNGARCCISGGR